MSEIELADLTDNPESNALNEASGALDSSKQQLASEPNNSTYQQQVEENQQQTNKAFTDFLQSIFDKAGIKETVTLDPNSADPIGDFVKNSEGAQKVMQIITDNVTSNALKITGATSLDEVAKSPDLQNKLSEKVAENSTQKYRTMRFVLALAAVGGAIGGIFYVLQKIAEHETGCYQFQGCLGVENGPITQIPQASCNCQQSSCASLVSLGFCPCQQTDCNAGNLKCDYSQCNIDYYWRNVSVGDVIAQAPGALQDLAKAAGGDFMDAISSFISQFKWVLIGIAGFVVLIIILVIIYKLVSKGDKNNAPEIIETSSAHSE